MIIIAERTAHHHRCAECNRRVVWSTTDPTGWTHFDAKADADHDAGVYG